MKSKNKSVDEVISSLNDNKSELDLGDDIVVNKSDLNVLVDTCKNKKPAATKVQTPKKTKVLIGVLSAVAVAGLAGSIIAPIVMSQKQPVTPETTIRVECLAKSQNDSAYTHSVKVENITEPKLKTEYNFKLILPQYATIDAIDIQIEGKSIEGYKFENNTVLIPAELMTGDFILMHIELFQSQEPSEERKAFDSAFSTFYSNYQTSGEGETHKFKSVSVPSGAVWNNEEIKTLKIKYINKLPVVYINGSEDDVIQVAGNTPDDINQMFNIFERAEINLSFESTESSCKYSVVDTTTNDEIYTVSFDNKGYITKLIKNVAGYKTDINFTYSDISTDITKQQFIDKLVEVETNFIAASAEYTADQVKLYRNSQYIPYKTFKYETPTIKENQSKVLRAYFEIENNTLEGIDLSVGNTFHSENLKEILPEESDLVDYWINDKTFGLRWTNDQGKKTELTFRADGYITLLKITEKDKEPINYSVSYLSDPRPSTGKTEFLTAYSEFYTNFETTLQNQNINKVSFSHEDYIYDDNEEKEFLSECVPVYDAENKTISIKSDFNTYSGFGMMVQTELEAKITELEQSGNTIKYSVSDDEITMFVENPSTSFYTWYTWNSDGFLTSAYVPNKMYISATWKEQSEEELTKEEWLSKYQTISNNFTKLDVKYSSDAFTLKLGKDEWFKAYTIEYGSVLGSKGVHIPELTYMNSESKTLTLAGGKLSVDEITNTLHMDSSDATFKLVSNGILKKYLIYSSESNNIYFEVPLNGYGIVSKYINGSDGQNININVQIDKDPLNKVSKQDFGNLTAACAEMYRAHVLSGGYFAPIMCAGSTVVLDGKKYSTKIDHYGITESYNEIQWKVKWFDHPTAVDQAGGAVVVAFMLIASILEDTDDVHYYASADDLSFMAQKKQSKDLEYSITWTTNAYMKSGAGSQTADHIAQFYRYI